MAMKLDVFRNIHLRYNLINATAADFFGNNVRRQEKEPRLFQSDAFN